MTYGQKLRRRPPVTLLILFIGFTSTTSSFGQRAGDRIVGTWTNETKTMEISFEQCADTYCAFIASVEEGSEQEDVHNPDPSLRHRSLIGLRIITGLAYEHDEWSDGTMYVPTKGIHVGVKLTLTAPDELRMTVSKLFLRRKATWTRAAR